MKEAVDRLFEQLDDAVIEVVFNEASKEEVSLLEVKAEVMNYVIEKLEAMRVDLLYRGEIPAEQQWTNIGPRHEQQDVFEPTINTKRKTIERSAAVEESTDSSGPGIKKIQVESLGQGVSGSVGLLLTSAVNVVKFMRLGAEYAIRDSARLVNSRKKPSIRLRGKEKR